MSFKSASYSSTVRTVLNCQRQNEGFSLFNGANANGRMRVSASVPKTVRSIDSYGLNVLANGLREEANANAK